MCWINGENRLYSYGLLYLVNICKIHMDKICNHIYVWILDRRLKSGIRWLPVIWYHIFHMNLFNIILGLNKPNQPTSNIPKKNSLKFTKNIYIYFAIQFFSIKEAIKSNWPWWWWWWECKKYIFMLRERKKSKKKTSSRAKTREGSKVAGGNDWKQ